MPCNWREAVGGLVNQGWSPSEVMDLTGEQLMWWYETLNLAAAETEKRRQRARKNG